MSSDKHLSDAVRMSLNSSCTSRSPPSNLALAITPSVAHESSASTSSSPPPFLFSRSDSSNPRKKRTVEILTEAALKKSFRKESEARYDFGSINLPKRQKMTPKKKETKAKLLDKKQEYSSLRDKDSNIIVDSISPQQNFLPCDDLGQLTETDEIGSLSRTIEPDAIDAYVHQLLTCYAFTPCDRKLQVFAVQDIIPDKMSLKPHMYHFIHRYGRSFQHNEIQWVYSCTCDVNRARFIASLNVFIDSCYENFCSMQEFSECIHIKASISIITPLDAVHSITPSIEFVDHTYSMGSVENPFELLHTVTKIGTSNTICVDASGSYAVLYISNKQRVTCSSSSCRHNQSTCNHVQHLLSVIDSCVSSQEDIPSTLLPFASLLWSKEIVSTSPDANTYQLSHRSWRNIPFDLPESLSRVLCLPYTDRFSLVDGIAQLIPDNTSSCYKCSLSAWSGAALHYHATVVTFNQLFKAKVYKLKCSTPNCDGELLYDGQEQALLAAGQHLFTYELLRRFMFQFFVGRTTIFTEHSVLTATFKDAGIPNLSKLVSYNHFRSGWYLFLELISGDIYFSDGFLCSKCGMYPPVLVMDATSLAFRRNLDFWSDDLLAETESTQANIIRKGSFSDRVFISNRRTRQLVMQYATKGLHYEQVIEMNHLASVHAVCLVGLFEFFESAKSSNQKLYQCPHVWRKFVQSLASSSPVCALLPPDDASKNLIKIMTERDIKDCPDAMSQLQTKVPVLFDLLLSVESYPHQTMSSILQEMFRKSVIPFVKDDNTSWSDQPVVTNKDESLYKSLSYFPNLPRVRERRRYEADKSTKEKVCTKRGVGHPSLLPGIFTVFCQHGICYGFQVMRMHESPNIPFTFLYERFEKAPPVIIYDNSCNLHNYCLNREPLHFMNCQFVVDKFHWPNHTGCSKAYDMRMYPQLSNINSQMVEQSNAALKRIKPSVSYMNSKHFMAHCIFYLWYRNHSLV